MAKKDKQNLEKRDEYAVKILGALNQLFNEEDGERTDNYIGLRELEDENNATQFLHALANMVPFHVYTKITGDDETDILGFNHMMNRLVLQNSKTKDQ